MKARLKQIIYESGYRGLITRLFSKLLREHKKLKQYPKVLCFGTYKKKNMGSALNRILKTYELAHLRVANTIPQEIVQHYLNHRFDLLGSGWVKMDYGMHCRGLEQSQYTMSVKPDIDSEGLWLKGRINQSNLAHSQTIWKMIDPAYQPIDWQLDFKSGYRWSEKVWSKKIKFGHQPGVDVKVPWELARMQHWPQLALVCFSNEHTDSDKTRIKNEFQNQLLDFIATNPPGFGVNWVCPMDVAIRAANWLLAYDLLLAFGFEFSKTFEQVFVQSIYEHGAFIVENLEWNVHRANHYLADIAGLAYIATYLPSNVQTDAWLAFSVQELTSEVSRQFYEDGGNFEGSTAYHRLSAEMVYYASALVLGLPQERLDKLKSYDHNAFKKSFDLPLLQPGPRPFYAIEGLDLELPFPKKYLTKLWKMADFVMNISKVNKRIPQVGDNDSGRFFKLAPIYKRMSVKAAKERYANLTNYDELPDNEDVYLEVHLDCMHLLCSASGLFGKVDNVGYLIDYEMVTQHPDYIITSAYSLGDNLKLPCKVRELEEAEIFQIGSEEEFASRILKLSNLPDTQLKKIEFNVSGVDFLKDLKRYAATEFGLYIFKSPRLYLMIRAWTGDVIEPSSHRHEDQLSLELSIDGEDLLLDPGTYLYTSSPALRLLYRESSGHFSPIPPKSYQVDAQRNVFGPVQLEKIELTYFGKSGFLAHTTGCASKAQLAVCLGDSSIIIYHVLDDTTKVDSKQPLPFSEGYGIKHIHLGP